MDTPTTAVPVIRISPATPTFTPVHSQHSQSIQNQRVLVQNAVQSLLNNIQAFDYNFAHMHNHEIENLMFPNPMNGSCTLSRLNAMLNLMNYIANDQVYILKKRPQ